MTLKQATRVGLAAFAFIGLGLGGLLISCTVLPLLSLDPQRARRHKRCQRAVQRSLTLFHDYMRVTGLVDFDPRKAPGPLPSGPCVLVANHPTLVDVTAVIAAYGELCVVAKASLFRNPLLGLLLRLSGHVCGDKRGFASRSEVIDAVTERLREGHRVLMFPEGTRSPDSGMRRFRAGAFTTAEQARVPIVPLAIWAQPPGLKHGDPWYVIPTTAIHMRIEPLGAIDPSDVGDARKLLVEARTRIETALAAEVEPTDRAQARAEPDGAHA